MGGGKLFGLGLYHAAYIIECTSGGGRAGGRDDNNDESVPEYVSRALNAQHGFVVTSTDLINGFTTNAGPMFL